MPTPVGLTLKWFQTTGGGILKLVSTSIVMPSAVSDYPLQIKTNYDCWGREELFFSRPSS